VASRIAFATMHGFGSHTYSFLNANDERIWVKFHFHSQQGMKPDGCRGRRRWSQGSRVSSRDLFDKHRAAVSRGGYPCSSK